MPQSFSLEWFFEPFESEMSFIRKPMFGCLAAYLDGKIVALLAENNTDAEWNGILLPTEHEFHEPLMGEYPFLEPHKILKKWLYLPITDPHFEERALELAEKIGHRHPMLGSIPKVKKKRIKKLPVKKISKPNPQKVGRSPLRKKK